ncbi:unannotated protein [freshwater metagenome]|uniref:Unannotated protein n=1 Tax=freshwater metagenome TaxID=449393 RepID=A0A6J7VWP2_9ZZZZ
MRLDARVAHRAYSKRLPLNLHAEANVSASSLCDLVATTDPRPLGRIDPQELNAPWNPCRIGALVPHQDQYHQWKGHKSPRYEPLWHTTTPIKHDLSKPQNFPQQLQPRDFRPHLRSKVSECQSEPSLRQSLPLGHRCECLRLTEIGASFARPPSAAPRLKGPHRNYVALLHRHRCLVLARLLNLFSLRLTNPNSSSDQDDTPTRYFSNDLAQPTSREEILQLQGAAIQLYPQC